MISVPYIVIVSEGLVFWAEIESSQHTILKMVAPPRSLSSAFSLETSLFFHLGPLVICSVIIKLMLVSGSWADMWLQSLFPRILSD